MAEDLLLRLDAQIVEHPFDIGRRLKCFVGVEKLFRRQRDGVRNMTGTIKKLGGTDVITFELTGLRQRDEAGRE